ncbi:MAG: hypothetical protein ACP5C3_00740, partial [Methanomicrobiales archaeon]
STIQNNTANGYNVYGGGIYNYHGNLNSTNSTIQNNTANGYNVYGGGIFNSGTGTLTINYATIESNTATGIYTFGGGIYNYGLSNINNSNIQNNSATGYLAYGGGIHNDELLYMNSCNLNNNSAIATGVGTNASARGGGLFNNTTSNINNCLIQNNTANCTHQNAMGGGILNDNNLNITGSTIQENTATGNNAYGGGIYNFGTLTANYNRIVNNSPTALHNGSSNVCNVEYNWWGSNNPNFGTLLAGNPVDQDPWLFMTIMANPNTINNGETSQITVSFNNYTSDGTTYTTFDPALGHIPNGTPVTFNTDKGSIGSKTIDKQTTDGVATATLTADETAGVAHVNAVTDDQTVYLDVNIDPKSSLYLTITPGKENPVVGDTVTYTLKVGNRGPDPAQDVVMTYTIPEGLEFAGANVDVGTYTYDPATRTLTWTIGEVPVGDPYMYLDLKILKAGIFLINPRLSTSTFDPTLNEDTQSLTVNAADKPTPKPVHGKTVGMQTTAMPVAALMLAVLMFLGGLVYNKK